jgi:hypothetical protein
LKLCALSDFSARTRAAAGMVEELPASPQVLRRDDVSLLRADETVFNAMADFIETQSARLLVPVLPLTAHSFFEATDSGFLGPGFEACMMLSIR